MDVKILKEIIIAFLSPTPSFALLTETKDAEGAPSGRQKKSFTEILIGLLSQFSRMTFIFHPRPTDNKDVS